MSEPTDTPADVLSPMKRALIEIRNLKSKLAAAETGRSNEPIAIVGVGLRFPGGANDADSYWELVRDGVDAITEVPADRWSSDELFNPDPDVPGKMSTRWGGFIDDVDQFDAGFFSISPREADSIDPQQRLLLHVAWEALEDANIAADDLFDSNTGVFIGLANTDYLRLLLADRDEIDTYAVTGNLASIAAGRLSYFLGTRGPSIALDTACSSSLVAVHMATRSLREGECDLALAGGVNLILSPEMTINFSRARMMAADGRCKTFDAAADGYVRSEGCAVVVLKRLTDAVADGDRVLAVVRGSAVNQDGRSGGLTAPNGPSQEAVVRAALADAGVAAAEVSYVEAHGTGTLLGDPIEVGALGAVLCDQRPPDQPLLIGSVKTNIGHTESAAGVAGLVKAALMLRHGQIAPHLHLDQLNPHIASRGLAIEVPRQLRDWPVAEGKRIVGVSSFGLSGTNAHIVLGEAPQAAPSASAPTTNAGAAPDVVTLSARTPDALRQLARRTATALADSQASLHAVARTTNLGRSHLAHRIAIVATDTADAARQLATWSDVDTTETASPSAAGTAFLFTGHGSSFAGMGRGLYHAEPVFAAAVDRCDDLLAAELGCSIKDVLFDVQTPRGMALAQPALFTLQYALSELWASWGVRPTIVAGHSAGEYVAAVVAGVMRLEDALRLIAGRGRLMDQLGTDGEMVAIFADEHTVATAVARRPDEIGIAAVNGPFTTVVSGRKAAVAALIAELNLEPNDLRRLTVSVAAHSPLVEPILDDFTQIVSGVALARPAIGLVSSMTGAFVDHDLTDPGYWRRHLRQPVRFADVFDTLRAAGCTTFVEIGPGSTLLNLGKRNWPDASGTWVASMSEAGDDSIDIATALGALYVAGVDIDWGGFGSHPVRHAERTLVLPHYPWQNRSHWAAVARRSAAPAASLTPIWPAVVDAARAQSLQGPIDLDASSYPARWQALNTLTVEYIAQAVRRLGLFDTDGATHTLDDLFAPGRMTDGYEHLGARWLEHLVTAGHLARDGERYVAPVALPTQPRPDVVDRALHALAGGVEPLFEYVERCGNLLAEVVCGDESPLATLFPDGSYETVDFNYNTWAVPRYLNAIAAAAVGSVAEARPRNAIRVLEIGAGTGGTTGAVLATLPGDRTSYTFTDVSDFFLVRAADRFGDVPFVQYRQLDIESDPPAQGFAAGSFDVIVAANVLHATRNLDITLANVRSLLAPGGVLVAIEATHHADWFDITTGLIEGWQRFDDGWRSDVPLIDVARWKAALASAGFVDVAAFPEAEQPTESLLQHVIVAHLGGDGVGMLASHVHTLSESAGADLVGGGIGDGRVGSARAADVHALLAAAMDDERIGIIIDAVRAGVAHVLRISDTSRLHRDTPLLDLGFDSLMAVELRNELRQTFALQQKLPATLAFDRPTIGAIADFIEGLLRPDASIVPEASAATLRTAITGERLDNASVEAMDDDEAEALLLAKLTEIES